MKILVLSDIRGGDNSGGRRHGLMCALALAEGGYLVTYVCDYMPVFYENIKEYFKVGNNFELIVDLNYLHTYVDEVEEIGPMKYEAYDLYIGYTREGAERAALYGSLTNKPSISAIFEAKNWVEEVYKQDMSNVAEWSHWVGFRKQILNNKKSHTVDLTLTGQRYTKEWLAGEDNIDYGDHRMHQIYAASNDRACDEAIIGKKKYLKASDRNDQIVFVGRLVDYKGFDKIIALIKEGKLDHMKCICISGYSTKSIRNRIQKRANEANIDLQIVTGVSEKQKFCIIKESKLLILPSLFEGQAIPLLEAAMCLTPCVAYDLPVYHEQHDIGDISWVKYAKYGDWEDFKLKCFESIRKLTELNKDELKQSISHYKEKFGVDALISSMDLMISKVMGEQKVEILDSDTNVQSESVLSTESIGVSSESDIQESGSDTDSGWSDEESSDDSEYYDDDGDNDS